MSEVTVICCWNDEKQYTDFVNTLKMQSCPYELMGIDNRSNKAFTSCAAAYNSVIQDVRTKYVIFSHQDILLKDADCISKFVLYLSKLKRDAILGVAGARFDTDGTFADFQHYDKQKKKFIPAGNHRLTGDLMECDTVDECFFGGHTEYFKEYPFDPVTCDGWHLYAADACLRNKQKNGRGGGIVFICNINLEHLSDGNISFDFVRGFCKLARKYHKDFPFIRVTCGYSKTDNFHLLLYATKTLVRRAIIKLLAALGLYKWLRKLLRKE